MEVVNLSKSYKNNLIIDNINLKLEERQIVFLMGKNGVGKTTFIKCILGLEKYSGQIKLPFKNDIRDIESIYDDAPLYDNLTGFQNIDILVNKKINKEQFEEWNYFYDEPLFKKKVGKYSYGERKKLSVLICMLNNPKYIFMDEVSNGLDYETMRELKKMLLAYSQNALIFLTGHNFDFYNDIVDTVLIMKDKQITLYETNFKKNMHKGRLSDVYEDHIISNETGV